jgi:hypothetical protein
MPKLKKLTKLHLQVLKNFKRKMEALTPINQHDDGSWYFWNEVWADEIGPFGTKEIAERALKDYGLFLDKGPNGIPKDSPLWLMKEEKDGTDQGKRKG